MEQKEFTREEARTIGGLLGIDFKLINEEEFRMGLGIELEHGSRDAQTDVTHSDEQLTGKIAWAHLKEIPDYYARLKKMEAEGK